MSRALNGVLTTVALVVFITHQCLLLHNTYITLYPYRNGDDSNGDSNGDSNSDITDKFNEIMAECDDNDNKYNKYLMKLVHRELIRKHEHKNIELTEADLRRFHQYAVGNAKRIKKRRFHSTRVFYVFKNDLTRDTGYVNEVDDIGYYRLKFKAKIELGKKTNVLGDHSETKPVFDSEHLIKKMYIRKLLGSKYTESGICNKNAAIKNAYGIFYYEKYDETLYVALSFDLEKVLTWTFPE